MSSRSLITRQIPALFNGVSQQPDTLRLPSQHEGQVNMLSTVDSGVMKRPPSQWVANVTTDNWDDAKIHTINRDVDNRYVVVVTDGDIQVFDTADGSEKAVTFNGWDDWAATTAYVIGDVISPTTFNGFLYRCTTAGTSAGSEPTFGTTLGGTTADNTATWTAIPHPLSVDTPHTEYACVTIADYTFIVNKTITCAVRDLPEAASEVPRYAQLYQPDITRINYRDVDFYNDQGNAALDGTVQAFSDLPASPSLNDYYKVEGADTNNFGGYYVRYNGSNVWEETYGPDSNEAIEEYSMPFVLVHDYDAGTWSLDPFAWLPRRFGDQQTNPPPTFIGLKLEEVFFYKNRLGLLSDENVVFSGAGDFGNFWRNTVTTLLDSDVVDVAVSTSRVSKLKHAVPFNNGLMLFADQTQFSLNVTDVLTPTSVSIDEVTSYEMDVNVEPVPINSEVYFATPNGAYSRIREYYVDGESNNTNAADVTAHVPRYVPSSLKQLAASGNEDVLFALPATGGTEDNRLYVYKFNWRGDEKIQSSWSQWDFDSSNTILGIAVIENTLYMLNKRSDGVMLEKVSLEAGAVAESLTHDILLDRRTTRAAANMSYSAGTNRTTVTLPYAVVGVPLQNEFYFIYEDRTNYEGMPVVSPSLQASWNSTTEVELLNGDYTSYTLICGVNYDSELEFSQLFNAGQDGVAITTGRTQIRTMTVYYEDATYFQTEVDPYGKNDPGEENIHPQYAWTSTGKTLGDGGLFLNQPLFADGAYQFSIGGDSRDVNIKLKNDYPYQAKFQSAEWEALYFNRSR